MERARPYDGALEGLYILRFREDTYLANDQSAEAVREFKNLISFDYVEGEHHYHDLARLSIARAHHANGDLDAARERYEEFFELMKGADEGIPVI